MNWLKQNMEDESFGSALLRNGVEAATIRNWCIDPRVVLELKDPRSSSVYGGIFDALEDTDVEECVFKCCQIDRDSKAALLESH